jgi:hypothetical protein
MQAKERLRMCEPLIRTRPSAARLAQLSLLTVSLLVALLSPIAANGGVLSEDDLKKAEALKPLFATLMNDLVQTAKRSDMAGGDVSCINSAIQELLQISDELESYEYLIAMDKDITGFGDNNPMRDIVKFAADKSNAILTSERKRLVQLSEQCARFPVAAGKTQQVLQVIDTTTGILTAIRDQL